MVLLSCADRTYNFLSQGRSLLGNERAIALSLIFASLSNSDRP
ncbi:hypothetical protein [Microcoleus sp. B9-D4]